MASGSPIIRVTFRSAELENNLLTVSYFESVRARERERQRGRGRERE
jgi:hypothetical protein